ncbi:MAG: hypothetical protein JWP91_2026 [Fibrobacteres bacterium]|nr:hypothetical protein [Fibrobacterota bacterium]
MRPVIEFRKGIRVMGHPLHTILVHFPIAFLFLVWPLEMAGWLAGWNQGWRLAWLAEAAGLVFAVPALITGLWDLIGLSSDRDRQKASALGNLHMMVMVGAVCVFGFALYLKDGLAPIPPPVLFAILGLSFAGTGLLIWGGWLGGEMVFRHGAGSRE